MANKEYTEPKQKVLHTKIDCPHCSDELSFLEWWDSDEETPIARFVCMNCDYSCRVDHKGNYDEEGN